MLVYLGSFPSYREYCENAVASGYPKFRVDGVELERRREEATAERGFA